MGALVAILLMPLPVSGQSLISLAVSDAGAKVCRAVAPSHLSHGVFPAYFLVLFMEIGRDIEALYRYVVVPYRTVPYTLRRTVCTVPELGTYRIYRVRRCAIRLSVVQVVVPLYIRMH